MIDAVGSTKGKEVQRIVQRERCCALQQIWLAHVAFGSTGEIPRVIQYFRFTPNCGQSQVLFDHLVGRGEQRRRDAKAKRLRMKFAKSE